MYQFTVRMPEDRMDRLKELAKSRGISINKMVEEWATMAIAEFDAHASFMARAARGSRARGLAALAELDRRDNAPEYAGYSLHEGDQEDFKAQ